MSVRLGTASGERNSPKWRMFIEAAIRGGARGRTTAGPAAPLGGPEPWGRCSGTRCGLLHLNRRAGLLELLLDLLGLLLVHAFLDGLGGGLDQVLGLLEAQAGDRSHGLDDLDLLVA